jgi:D-sedoheptulose 7-phosphate isomerase
MLPQKFKQLIEGRIRLLKQIQDADLVYHSGQKLADCLRRQGKILIFGNGGSATQASHFAAELVNRFRHDRSGLAAVALNTDIAALTSIANDSDYRYVFSRQIDALGREGDFAVGLTTSGQSPNVLAGLQTAKEKGLSTMCLCGADTESLQRLKLDWLLSVPSQDTPAIQEIHLLFLHVLAEEVENRMMTSSPEGDAR